MNPDRKCELLSPAGSFEAACAAFAFGADAVYLGLAEHSARAEAVNFTEAELESVCAYAHSLSPRRCVYVAVNTLVRDSELEGVARAIAVIAESGCDGIIVQDAAVAAMARRFFPALPIHASTQMCVHNVEGAMAAREMGFSRVVLARELTFGEIREIDSASGIETEVFIQGALCYGYSGECLFSALATGRSGNRGECAYCCRGRFSTSDGRESFPFSMRDLSLDRHVALLRDAGIRSLKIEGRMKSPLYVAAATRLYRLILDGAADREISEARDDLKTVFSRPATTLYFNGRDNPGEIIDAETVGHRGLVIGKVKRISGGHGSRRLCFTTNRAIELHDGIQIDLPGRPYGFAAGRIRLSGSGRPEFRVPAGSSVEIDLPHDAPSLPIGAAVSCSASQETRRRLSFAKPRASELAAFNEVDVSVALRPNVFSASSSFRGERVHVDADVSAAPACDPIASNSAVERAFSRMGASRWRARRIEIDNPSSLFAPASLLNELRRKLCGALDECRRRVLEREANALLGGVGDWRREAAQALSTPDFQAVPRGLSVKTAFEGEPSAVECDELVLDVRKADMADTTALVARMDAWRALNRRIRVALPLIMRGDDFNTVEYAVRILADAGLRDWEVSELSGLRLVRRICVGKCGIVAASSLYAMNPISAMWMRSMGIAAAVVPAECDAGQAQALCTGFPGFFIFCASSRPALFVSETRPLANLDAGGHAELKDRLGASYTVECRDGLWITRQMRPRRMDVPAGALRWRREDF